MDMMNRISRKQRLVLLVLAVLLPVLALGVVTYQKAMIYAEGVEVRFPIEGYDPRDLIAGHYLIYQIDYGIGEICAGDNVPARYGAKAGDPFCLCITDTHPVPPEIEEVACEEIRSAECAAILRGKCEGGRPVTGLERFFINEGKAAGLDKMVRQGNSRIVVKIDRAGTALVYDLEAR